jgi:hypothetical protein
LSSIRVLLVAAVIDDHDQANEEQQAQHKERVLRVVVISLQDVGLPRLWLTPDL